MVATVVMTATGLVVIGSNDVDEVVVMGGKVIDVVGAVVVVAVADTMVNGCDVVSAFDAIDVEEIILLALDEGVAPPWVLIVTDAERVEGTDVDMTGLGVRVVDEEVVVVVLDVVEGFVEVDIASLLVVDVISEVRAVLVLLIEIVVVGTGEMDGSRTVITPVINECTTQ